MNKVKKPFICVFIFGLIFLSACSHTNKDDWLGNVPGIYKGIIVSGGVNSSSVTRLYQGEKGIEGEFSFMDNNVETLGHLYDCQIFAEYQLVCQWEDKYGKGDLLLFFNQSLTTFEGLWNAAGSKTQYRWNGSK